VTASRFSPIHLLIALSIFLTLALGGALLFIFLAPTSERGPANVTSSKHIAAAQTASGVNQQGVPTDANNSFAIGQRVYIAYLVNDAGPGTVRIKLYNNGALIDTQTQHFARRSTYNAYFVFQAEQAGNWEADLYWQAPGIPGDGTLEQQVTFLVGSTSLGLPRLVPATSQTHPAPWQTRAAHVMMTEELSFRARPASSPAQQPGHHPANKETAHATNL
jgi:hypothetical protein